MTAQKEGEGEVVSGCVRRWMSGRQLATRPHTQCYKVSKEQLSVSFSVVV